MVTVLCPVRVKYVLKNTEFLLKNVIKLKRPSIGNRFPTTELIHVQNHKNMTQA